MSTVVAQAVESVHRSKWGFHPCSFGEFVQLKEAHKRLLLEYRRYRAHERWARKDPKNRVVREAVRDAAGRKIGRRVVGPAPEPTRPAAIPTYHGKHLYLHVLKQYQQARRPAATPEEVRPLDIQPWMWEQVEKLREGQ